MTYFVYVIIYLKLIMKNKISKKIGIFFTSAEFEIIDSFLEEFDEKYVEYLNQIEMNLETVPILNFPVPMGISSYDLFDDEYLYSPKNKTFDKEKIHSNSKNFEGELFLLKK